MSDPIVEKPIDTYLRLVMGEERYRMAQRAKEAPTEGRYRSRPFDPTSTDPRHVIAEALARHEGRDDIPPGAWWRAAHVVKALKDASMLRTALERKARLAPVILEAEVDCV